MSKLIEETVKEFRKLKVCKCRKYCFDTKFAIETFLRTALEAVDKQAREDERETISNRLYNLVPTGKVDAFQLIKFIEKLQNSLTQKEEG